MRFSFNRIDSLDEIHRDTWQNVLLNSNVVAPFLDYDWMRIWLKHFADAESQQIIAVFDQNKQLVGVVPLVQTRQRYAGIPFTELLFAANSHSFRSDIIAKADLKSAIFTDLWHYLLDKERFDNLKFKEYLADPALFKEFERQNIPYSLEEQKQPPYIDIKEDWESFFANRRGHFRRNLRRRMRNAAKDFKKVEYRVLSDAAENFDEWMNRGFVLEASGWKGKQGSAILKSERVKQFYFDIAHTFHERGLLHIGGLFFGDRMVAFNFSLIYQDVFYLLKIAYDESLGRYSPGQIMMFHLLKKVFDSGLKCFDFLGPSMPWKLEWADKHHTHYTLFLYAPSLKGRSLLLLNRKFLPVMRKIPVLRKIKKKASI